MKNIRITVLVSICLLIASCDTPGWQWVKDYFAEKKTQILGSSAPEQKVTPSMQSITVQEAFEQVANVALPAVVNISTNQKMKAQPFFQNPFEDNPLFRDFFGDFFGESMPRQREYKSQSLGSGFVLSQDGYIATNDHVIKNADEISVKLHDKRTFIAKVIGRDPKTDVAVIKISATKLPVLKIADSNKIKIGQWAIAVGNPFGLNGTLTVGVVSAKGRSNLGIETYEDFIQTDASINPGNSGGPLLNIHGEVIGINTAIVAAGQGIGFAIPINMAKGIIDQIVSKGTIERSWIGIGLQKLTPELAESMRISGTTGVLVNRIYDNSPAKKAGIREGDVVLECNSIKLEDPSDLQKIVVNQPLGTILTMTVVREGTSMTVKVKTEKMPADDKMEKADTTRTQKNAMGVAVREMLPKEKSSTFTQEGVVISSIEAGSPAEQAGLQEGDIIFNINQQTVRSLADFNRIAGNLKKGKIINILLQRGGATFYVALRL